MRIVKWSSQQRVDLFDKQAENDLVLGEFRRTVRALIHGQEEGRIVRGFEVEPQTVPDTTVAVNLDPGGGGDLSLAIAAEDKGGGLLDHGQLMGDKDTNGNLEGANLTIDFTGQPVDTYFVQIQFSYLDGVPDNRAFWNAGTDVEFIANTDTRQLPTITHQLVTVASAAPWITLATVVWDGVSIDAADITDARTYPFEGATPFQQTTWGGTGGMPDFDRTATRDVTNDSVYSVLKKLGRQIQDIKGQDNSGNFNFWNYPLSAPDPSGNLTPGEQARSLAVLDKREFIVGDGTTTFGDFNGATGLNAALAFVAVNQAVLPNKIRIVLKTDQREPSAPIWTLTATHIFTSDRLDIEIDAEHAAVDSDSSQWRTRLDFSSISTAWLTSIGEQCRFTLRNIESEGEIPHTLLLGAGTTLRMYNCGFTFPSGEEQAIACSDRGLEWQNCDFPGAGRFFLGVNAVSGDANSDQRGAVIEDCVFGSQANRATHRLFFRLWNELNFSETGSDVDDARTSQTCKDMAWRRNTFYSGEQAATADYEAVIDGRGVQNCEFVHNECFTPLDSNFLAVGDAGSNVTPFVSKQWEIAHNRFDAQKPTVSVPGHTVLGGYNGAIAGVGWSVWVRASYTPASDAEYETTLPRDIAILDNYWTSVSETDAGCVYTEGFNIQIRGNRMHNLEFQNVAGTGVKNMAFIRIGLAPGSQGTETMISANHIGRMDGTNGSEGPHTIRGVYIFEANANISNNVLELSGLDGQLGITAQGDSAGVHFSDECVVSDNVVSGWPNGARASAHNSSMVSCNRFEENSTAMLLQDTSTSNISIVGNLTDLMGTGDVFILAAAWDASVRATVTGNHCRTASVGANVIDFGSASSVVFIGNNVEDGDVVSSSVGTFVGGTAQNLVNAFV